MTKKPDYDQDLVGILAHDLRAPISSVRSFIELLEHSGPLSDKQIHFMNRAISGLERMEVLVNDVLNLSRADGDEEIVLKPISLKRTAQDSVILLEGLAKKQEITTEILFDEDVFVNGNDQILQQIVNNLISNGIKYNESGGHVWINVDTTPDYAILTVQDDGLGIADDDLPRIFDRFFRSKQGKLRRIDGSGLGLAIVKVLVEKLQGAITVESQLGEGTLFTVKLPRANPPAS